MAYMNFDIKRSLSVACFSRVHQAFAVPQALLMLMGIAKHLCADAGPEPEQANSSERC